MTAPLVLHISAVEYTLRRLVLPQLEALAGLGFDVRVACAPQEATFDRSLQPFHPRTLRFPRALNVPALVSAAGQLRRIVGDLQPALVHFHSPAASIPGRAVLALFGKGGPLVAQTVHGFLAQRESASVVAGASGTAERLLSRFTDLSLFVSAEDMEEASRAGYRGALRYVGNGVGDEWFDHSPRQARSGRLRAVFVGRVVQGKGVLDLLQAMATVDGVELTVIGDQLPTDRDGVMGQARKLADRLGGRVSFTGMIEAPEIRRHLREADLMVLPSHREGVPTSVIEAMAMGLPIIATSIRGCRELVQPGVNGWLVEPGDTDALAGALQESAGAAHSSLVEMGSASRNRALQYRQEPTFDRLLKAYGELGLG